jgi:DNA polymerase IV
MYGLADLDCFFVECERLHRPELRGRAVVIGGQPHKRGVVAACSYEARQLGIHSAMPMAQAYKLAEGHPVVFMHSALLGRYDMYSRRVQDILRAGVPTFIPKGLDEFVLDLRGCEAWAEREYGNLEEYVHALRRRVRDEVRLPLSIGLGPSRIIAKIASRHAKPDGIYVVRSNEALDFLRPQPVKAVPGIGPVTTEHLRRRGITTIGQLLEQPESFIRAAFGVSLLGIVAALKANKDADPVIEQPSPRVAKSIGHETTFPKDTLDLGYIETALWELTEEACRRLREKGFSARHLTVRVRYSDFATVSKGGFLDEATDADYSIFTRARELFYQAHSRRLRIRLVGVRLDKLTLGSAQAQLFATEEQRREQELFRALDRIRFRYGEDAVLTGHSVGTLRRTGTVAANSPSQLLKLGGA